MSNKSSIHTISFVVANKPGVLSRIAIVFARRGYNIDALSVSPAFNPRYSSMTITAKGDPGTLDQIIKQTDKLVDVLHVSEHFEDNAVHREVSLVKVKYTSTTKPIIQKLVKKFGATIIEQSPKTLIIEQTGITDQLDEFESNLKRYGVVEMVRSGKLVMAKGQIET